MKNDIDMLNGSIADKIIKFALPLAITGLLQQLFNAMDVAVVGKFAEDKITAMAAVGSNAPVVGLMVNLFVGISLGANVVISRFIGQKNEKGIRSAVHTSILVSLICGIFMTLIGTYFSKDLLMLLKVPDNVMPMSLKYIRIYLLGMPVILLYNFEAAIFRSSGDTKSPLICLSIAGIINVCLNLLLVKVFHMAAEGVAIATVVSNMISGLLLFIKLLRSKTVISISFKEFKIDSKILLNILKIGVPAGVQGMVFSISNLCVQSAINELGDDIMAASSAAFNIEIFAYYIINAYGQACTTFIGQNYGAGKLDRCKKVIRADLLQSIGVTIVMTAVILLAARPLLWLFTDNPAVIEPARERIFFIVGFELVNVFMEIYSGAMRGFGFSLSPAIITLIGVCGIRIYWVFKYFPAHKSFTSLLICYPISWILTAIGLVLCYYLYVKRKALKITLS
ncbi:MAG: MATE family efflux transporter [Lachnospiraceae bacterium]|nr:MATE family efflux transporter [Lachnospiraceae bacterium]